MRYKKTSGLRLFAGAYLCLLTAATRFDDLKHTPRKHEISSGIVCSWASGAPFNGVDFFAVRL